MSDIIPFGKYKGRSLKEVARVDADYLKWLQHQPWFKKKFAVNVTVNNYSEGPSQDSPEHNALQARFLDEDFLMEIFAPFFGRDPVMMMQGNRDHDYQMVRSRADEAAAQGPRPDYLYGQKDTRPRWEIVEKNSWPDARIAWRTNFEVEGADVSVRAWVPRFSADICKDKDAEVVTVEYFEVAPERYDIDLSTHLFWAKIECKPSIGEDYPAILRQMKRNKCEYLVYERFVAESVPLEKVKKIFAASEIRMIQVKPEPQILPPLLEGEP